MDLCLDFVFGGSLQTAQSIYLSINICKYMLFNTHVHSAVRACTNGIDVLQVCIVSYYSCALSQCITGVHCLSVLQMWTVHCLVCITGVPILLETFKNMSLHV